MIAARGAPSFFVGPRQWYSLSSMAKIRSSAAEAALPPPEEDEPGPRSISERAMRRRPAHYLDVLNKARDTVKAGARGIIFGRNIFMAEDPSRLVSALNGVMNEEENPEEAIRKYNL